MNNIDVMAKNTDQVEMEIFKTQYQIKKIF